MQDKNKKYLSGFGSRLKSLRQKIGINQTEFAQILGFGAPIAVSRFERGERLPPIESLLKLSETCDIDIHWLVTGNPSPITKEHKEALADSVRRLRYVCNAYSALLHEKETALVKELDALNARRKAGETIDEPHAQELLSEHSKIVEQFNHIHSAINTLPAITADL